MLKELVVQNHTLFYQESGSGSPVVLLHGSLCDYRYWRWQIAELSTHHRVIAPSLPGYWPGLDLKNFRTDIQAELIHTLLSTLLPSEKYHLLGHSRGAQVATQMAINDSSVLSSLTLADPGFNLSTQHSRTILLKRVVALLDQDKTDEALALFVDTVNGPSTWKQMVSWFKTMVRDNAATLIPQAKDANFTLNLNELRVTHCPTLFITGQFSPIEYKNCIDFMKRHVPHAYSLTISQAAHGMNLANPKAFNQSLIRFLNAADRHTAKTSA